MKKKIFKRIQKVLEGELPMEELSLSELKHMAEVVYYAVEAKYEDRLMPSNDTIH